VSENETEVLESQVWTVPQAGQLLGLCSVSAYAAARAGKIPTIRLGVGTGKLRVPKIALQRLLDCNT
jgi:hypothetical protein